MVNEFETKTQRREQTGPDEGFAVLAVREAKPGLHDKLREEIHSLMTDARDAAGLISVDVLQPFEEPAVFVHFERYLGMDQPPALSQEQDARKR